MSQEQDGFMGLLADGGGKRVYRAQVDEVQRDEFEAQKLIHMLVFGEKGLADTLGPTWEMIHDPRFVQIENAFIVVRKGRLGGDATSGQSKQLADGSFTSGAEDLNQYSEILGEGRYLHSVLRSMSYHAAIAKLWPERRFAIPKKEYLPGLFVFNRLRVEEQAQVLELAQGYTEFFPGNLAKQSDESLWRLIKQECPNYYNPRTNKFNREAHQLFAIVKLDLVGLIDDYAEVAKLQEWVLLDNEQTLVEQQHIDIDAPRVWAEVEMLERALTLRASLRATAAQVMASLGLDRFIATMEITLTDFERDDLLKIVYSSNYPDDQPELITQITAFLTAIKATGKCVIVREQEQCGEAIVKSREYVAKLKSGEIEPINRETDPGEEIVKSEEWKIADEIQNNPIKQMLFLRLTSVEGHFDRLKRDFISVGDPLSEDRREELLEHWLRAVEDPNYTIVTNYPVEAEDSQRLQVIAEAARVTKGIQDLLLPVFERADYQIDEEGAHDLLMKAEELAPTRRLETVDKTAELGSGATEAPAEAPSV